MGGKGGDSGGNAYQPVGAAPLPVGADVNNVAVTRSGDQTPTPAGPLDPNFSVDNKDGSKTVIDTSKSVVDQNRLKIPGQGGKDPGNKFPFAHSNVSDLGDRLVTGLKKRPPSSITTQV
jgi:hypothetical protein